MCLTGEAWIPRLNKGLNEGHIEDVDAMSGCIERSCSAYALVHVLDGTVRLSRTMAVFQSGLYLTLESTISVRTS